MEIESLTTGKHGRGDLMELRRREDEKHVLRRLFKRLQKRIERRDGKHMHLVDDVDAKFQIGRRINYAVAKLSDAVDTVVARRVHFHDIRSRARFDGKTSLAFTARISVFG